LNNVLGTRNIVETSYRFGVDRFIMISTDNGVRPSSVMGASKRIAKMISSHYTSGNNGRFVSVRFGNVHRKRGECHPPLQETNRTVWS